MSPAALTLKTVDPDRVACEQAACAILAQPDPAWTMTAVAANAEATSGPWLGSEDGPWLSMARVSGEGVVLHPERLDGIVAALDASDALLSHIEHRLNVAIEPVTTRLKLDQPVIFIAITAFSAEDPSADSALTLALPIALAAALPSLASLPLAAAIRLGCRIEISAPPLSVSEASGIAEGDLLILHGGTWRMKIGAPGHANFDASLDPLSGQAKLLTGDSTRGPTMNDDGQSDFEARIRQFRVPVSVRLPDVPLTVETLSGLAPGATLDVGPVTAGLSVEIIVGGCAIAQGELVRLGERFAVLVDRADAATADGRNVDAEEAA